MWRSVYWDGVGLIPNGIHSSISQELRASGPYRSEDLGSPPSVDERFELPRCQETKIPSRVREDHASTSTVYSARSSILSGPGTSQHMYMKLFMRDGFGSHHELDCLLDTGASANCISRSRAKFLEPSSSGLIRETNAPLDFTAANGEVVQAHLTFKGIWNFTNRDQEYTHHFYLIDGLPTDVVLCCQTILQYGFLMQNPELLCLGLPRLGETPELNILSMKKPSEGQYWTDLTLRIFS